ncbi:hypothetical protein ACFQVB_06755 [Paraburkholderia humisilvae]|uniref:hypothetical protein n=1 Tax=Paraburkholderia humisilvae TaxID=627669 RepID=UPI0036117D46
MHLHLTAHGNAVRVVGSVLRNGVRWRAGHGMTRQIGRLLFAASAGAATTYHQWLVNEVAGTSWTLGCGRAQEPRMRGNKPAYVAAVFVPPPPPLPPAPAPGGPPPPG